jgi:hypothetical protein
MIMNRCVHMYSYMYMITIYLYPYTFICSHMIGMGLPLRAEDGLFLTWHFSLFSSLFNRMKRSKRRTFDPEKASLFIIPYDLGLDGYLDPKTCKFRRKCSDGFPDTVQKTILNMTYFKRHKGADHVVLWSLGQYHPMPVNRCDIFIKDFCAKCTHTSYWMDPTIKDNRFWSFFIFSWVDFFGYLLLGCSVISVSFIICMLTLLLMPLGGLHLCVGLDFVTRSL